jgi:hypothetical protein
MRMDIARNHGAFQLSCNKILKITEDPDMIALSVFFAIGLTISLGLAIAFSSLDMSAAAEMLVQLPGL